MLKRILSCGVICVLLLCMTACKKNVSVEDLSSASQQSSQISSQEPIKEITDADAKAIFKEKSVKAWDLYMIYFAGIFENVIESENDYCLEVDDSRFSNIAELKTFTEKIFEKDFAQKMFYKDLIDGENPSFFERDGKLFYNPGGMGMGRDFNIETVKVISQDENQFTMTVDSTHYITPDEIENREVIFKKVDGEWKLASDLL